ncbi:uncharacterized protein ColSpa_03764 [Colletotrichum spaethianum]|uniref:Uncharacterized protein n=1 Tax=Colletotrichum spaethianum TaxID=700344 RepID=A0AA37P0I5_9PEZI|nr:uncharacterized protein ColSpa_03764 [Colletotrichum spaethianum]GKT43583.1 hypothetical protein ColSpa_03764 [Colletotrichum spaethianum]
MSMSQLPSIDDQLVTADNPPRTDLSDGMDHARCAALHNYLVEYCRAADGRLDPAAEGSCTTYFSTHGDAAEAVRPRLHPSVAAFLAAARTPDAPLFYFVAGMPDPDGGDFNGLFDNETADIEDEPKDSIVRLYFSHMDACGGKSGGGMLYHQGRHLASFFVHPDDTERAFPVDEHSQNWHFFETILSNWIALIRLGKVVASPTDDPALYGSVKIGNWEWRPYGDGQIAGCVAAWDRLCGVTEVRRRQSSGATVGDEDNHPNEPLLTPAAMNAAGIPDPSSVRTFLGLARRPPHIRQIALGLSLPPAHGATFAAAQPFTHLPRRVPQWDGTTREGIVPPVYIFFSEEGTPQVDTSGLRSSFRYYWEDGHGKVPDGITFPSSVPPGAYSECVIRSEPEATEEAFRLPLPFNLYGARLSSGDEMMNRAADELFQHGFKPFGGDPNRPQRLERLLDHWASLVERGVWSVGPHGVQGSIEVFKDSTVDWASYAIPSSW